MVSTGTSFAASVVYSVTDQLLAYLEQFEPRLDVDGNGESEALTDGLLLLKHRFGFSGESLLSGAVPDNCVRCEAGDISTYIN